MLNTRLYHKEKVIFRENSEGDNAYIIKSGKVEISKLKGDKKVVLARLDEGSIFGEMALLGTENRLATAKVIEAAEVVVINRDQLNEYVKKNPTVTKTIIKSLVKRLEKTTARVSACKSDNVFMSICRIIHLMCRETATSNMKSGWLSESAKKQAFKIGLKYDEVLAETSNIISVSSAYLKKIIDVLASLNLIKIENRKGKAKFLVVLDFNNFISQCEEAYSKWKDAMGVSLLQETELVHINEVASLMEVPLEDVYKKIGLREAPEDLFLVRKKDFIKWINDKRSKKTRKRVKVEDIKELEDLVFVDNETIRQVFTDLEVYKICRVLKNTNEAVKKMVFDNLSKRMVNIVKKEIKMISRVDGTEAGEIEDEIIKKIKSLKAGTKTGKKSKK
jgi:hypothetical protein